MRTQFAELMESELEKNPLSVLILGDIGVHGHRNSFRKFPGRVFNIGILEQSMVGFAAGLALEGLVPTLHTIAPFLVERAYEQIKIDFGYQKLRGNFVTVGASYDYSTLGSTHHCPGDVALMLNIPGTEIYVPGTAKEFKDQFTKQNSSGNINYFRLSAENNKLSYPSNSGEATLIRSGKNLTVLAVGPILDRVVDAAKDLDVNLLYYNCISPFDSELVLSKLDSDKLLVVEPFYEGTMAPLISSALCHRKTQVKYKGVPREFITNYGSLSQINTSLGLDSKGLRKVMIEMIDE